MLLWLLTLVALVTLGLAVRFYLVLPARITGRKWAQKKAPRKISALIVLGSGGHTMEMLQMLSLVPAQYELRHYVVAETDTMSAKKAAAFEGSRAQQVKVRPQPPPPPKAPLTDFSCSSSYFSYYFLLIFSFFLASCPDWISPSGSPWVELGFFTYIL